MLRFLPVLFAFSKKPMNKLYTIVGGFNVVSKHLNNTSQMSQIGSSSQVGVNIKNYVKPGILLYSTQPHVFLLNTAYLKLFGAQSQIERAKI